MEHQGGQKGRKIGRSARKPAHKRYNSEMRWMKNKERRIAKQKKFEEKKRNKRIITIQKEGLV